MCKYATSDDVNYRRIKDRVVAEMQLAMARQSLDNDEKGQIFGKPTYHFLAEI